MINVRFDLVPRISNPNHDYEMARYKLLETPQIGEIINIKGDPFVVFSRAWAIDEKTEELWCYIKLVRPHND